MPQPLKTLFNSDMMLHELLSKAETLTSLQRHFASVVPGNLGRSVQILGLQLGQLSIATANATIAAKLRQLAPEIVQRLQNRGCEVSGIRIKVQVSYDLPPIVHHPRKLSTSAQKALQEFSMSLGDSPLKNALDRMAKDRN